MDLPKQLYSCTGEESNIFARTARGSRNFDETLLHGVIFSYFDDSSDERRQKYFVCGGILGHEDSWTEFERLWSAETRGLKEPFRSTDCECQRGQFATWQKADCDALMARLVSLIRENREGYRMGGFASVIPVAEYHSAFPKSGTYDPYYLAVTHTILNMAHLAAKHGEKVQLWFEEGSKRKGKPSPISSRIIRIYESLKRADWPNRDRLRGVTFDTKELPPLQAADLIAREAFKHVVNRGSRPTRKPVERMWEQIAFLLADKTTLEHCALRGWPRRVDGLATWKESDNPPLPDLFYAVNMKEKAANQG